MTALATVPAPMSTAPAAAATPLVRVAGLTLGYGAAPPVVEAVDLSVAAGELVSLVGPSGSGKSTILRALVGLHPPRAGTIACTLAGCEIGFLFQEDALLPWRTVRQNVALGLRLAGRSRAAAEAEAEVWLERLGLGGLGERWPRQLSGGQRKRVALAQVMALRPRLLLMDEPFAALDAILRRQITQELLDWVEGEGIAVLLVTHDLEEAIALSDRILLLGRGPRARIRGTYEVPIPRPRDLVAVHAHPAFAPLLQRLWTDLAAEVAGSGLPRAAA